MDGEPDVVLVTGGSGLIGSALIPRLAQEYSVIVLDQPDKPPGGDVEFVPIDLTDDASVVDALDRVRGAHGERLASVVHLAAYYAFSDHDDPRYDKVTVEGTARMLQFVRERFSLEQFLFSSTMLVHAPGEPGQRIRETSRLEATWPYPASKVRTEQLLRERHGDVPVVLLRIAGVYDDQGHSPPIADQIRRIAEQELGSHFYPGPLDRGQAFVHREDLVEAMMRVISRRGQLPPETALLIGEDRTFGYGEVQDAIGQAYYGEAWATLRVPKLLAKAGAWVQDENPLGREQFVKPFLVDQADYHYALDISRARELLGWQPRHTLIDTIPAMVRALKNDPAGWYRENGLEFPGG